jgi:hypothetical protein
MGVHVDESGGDDASLGVDRASPFLVDVADLDDPTVPDADVGSASRSARPVDDVSSLDEHIEHGFPLYVGGPSLQGLLYRLLDVLDHEAVDCA